MAKWELGGEGLCKSLNVPEGIIDARKKPVMIRAIKWTGDNYYDVKDFCGEVEHSNFKGSAAWLNKYSELNISTLEGFMHATIGDFIIEGVDNENYPCKASVFHKTYDIV